MSTSDSSPRPSRLRTVHLETLAQWRNAMNLVGPQALEEHFEDCDHALEVLRNTRVHGDWFDLGSGAGFPGLVFADLYPETSVTLIESRAKRAAFLQQVLALSGTTHARVAHLRVEAMPARSADGVISRAFAPPEQVFTHAGRLLRPQGQLVMWMQDDAHLPATQVFHVEHTHTYNVRGKKRQSVLLRKV